MAMRPGNVKAGIGGWVAPSSTPPGAIRPNPVGAERGGYRAARSIGVIEGELPAWISPTTSNPKRW